MGVAWRLGGVLGRRVSIWDIAEEAGVSITTVSHALSGKGRLPDRTREKVRRAARRLGYRASTQARGLATGRSMALAVQVVGTRAGVLVPDFQYFVELLNAASAEAIERGYGLVLAPAGAGIEGLGHLSPDGIVVVDPTGEEPLLQPRGIPVVTAARVPEDGRETAWVDSDHHAGTRRVLDHFLEAGRSRPALLTSTARQSYVDDTTAAYTTWCKERGLEPIVGLVAADPTEEAAAAVMGDLLTTKPRPDAVYATFDRMALGVLLACRERRISVPEDLAVAALTDSPLLRTTVPQITALDLDAPEIGRRVIELLVALVEGEEPASRQIMVPSTLIVRESTRHP